MVYLLPPHYVQLAAALGLNPQSVTDPTTTVTDFENLIEQHQTGTILKIDKVRTLELSGFEVVYEILPLFFSRSL
jgi:hypothetical protein